ncbi:hypothetical protein [Lysobacter sp. Root983]|uniref:hypothetical protein n=1 Tax=Lysobacter sp. Root983 TaxID=1736613 RepID=UPI00070980F3|nr:hypothetical protein [Lysobacter sp. Root983]KRD79727.1 hypothetical protein ASE43_02165 [Lysobacter sp. Root983]
MQSILMALERIAADGRSGFVDLESLVMEVRKTIEGCAIDDLRFVCRFLDVERECRYVDPSDGHEKGTRSRTRLLNYDPRRDRVKLTETGRFFLRLGNVSHNWLYEDKQAAKILQAIKLGQFSDVEQFALDHARALRQLAEDINRQIESPSFDAMAQVYAAQREAINEMLHDAAQYLVRAKAELAMESTQEQLERFCEIRPDRHITLHRLRWVLDRAHGAMESASRTWAGFLRRVQEGRRRHLGVVDFGSAMGAIMTGHGDQASIERALTGIYGWIAVPTFASVFEVDAVLPPARDGMDVTPLVFDTALTGALDDQLQSWLDHNLDALRAALDQGPQRLSELIDSGGLPPISVTSIHDVSAVFASFAVSHPFGQREPVELGIAPDAVHGVKAGFHWSLPDLILSLPRGKAVRDDTV